MKEEKLILTSDNKTFLNKDITNTIHSLHYLLDLVNKEEITNTMAKTLISSFEYSIYDLNEVLQLESLINEEKDQRLLDIRTANQKIRSLENKLSKLSSNNISPEYVSDVIKNIRDTLTDKLRKKDGNGISGIININIKSEYQVEIEYVPMFTYSSSFSKTPETDKKNFNIWIDKLKKEGFEFSKTDNMYLELTDNNIQLLEKKIEEVLPTMRFTKLKNWNRKESSVINSISFNISLSDLIFYTMDKSNES
jgi:hypothetical protein